MTEFEESRRSRCSPSRAHLDPKRTLARMRKMLVLRLMAVFDIRFAIFQKRTFIGA
jgi:hypothetical protein